MRSCALFTGDSYALRITHYALVVASSTSTIDRKSTRLNSSHLVISYAVFCLKKKNDADTDPAAVDEGVGAVLILHVTGLADQGLGSGPQAADILTSYTVALVGLVRARHVYGD